MGFWSWLFGKSEVEESEVKIVARTKPVVKTQKNKYRLEKRGNKQYLRFDGNRDLLRKGLSDCRIEYVEIDDGFFELSTLETVILLSFLFDINSVEDDSMEYPENFMNELMEDEESPLESTIEEQAEVTEETFESPDDVQAPSDPEPASIKEAFIHESVESIRSHSFEDSDSSYSSSDDSYSSSDSGSSFD